MKIKFTFLILFCSTLLFAQDRVFQHSVGDNSLSARQKISKELADTYVSTSYCQQTSFNLNADLEITLPNRETIKAVYDRTFSYTNNSQSFVYKVKNQPYAELVFSKVDNIVTGMYLSEAGKKIIFHQTDANIFAISVVSEEVLINNDKHDNEILQQAIGSQKSNPNICLSSTPVCPLTTIDLMVLFTTQAKNAWGGLAQSKSFVATAITNFNISLLNSGVSNVNINLLYADEINYVESGNINTDLTRFRTANDTYMDEVATLRSTYGADLSALITSTPTNTCGLGYLNPNPINYVANNGFCVAIFSCVVSNYTLAHEFGHNMGLNHDWYVNQSVNPCEHQHGYTNKTAIELGTSSTSSQRWRTIMAYNDECSDAGFSCTRINRWSNPLVNYNADPTGIPIGSAKPSNEAFGYARFACVVSEFMPTKTLAVKEMANIEDFTLFPNPAKDQLNIRVTNGTTYIYKITNLVGQIVIEGTDNNINLRGFVPGEYILSVYSKGNIAIGSKKFIVK